MSSTIPIKSGQSLSSLVEEFRTQNPAWTHNTVQSFLKTKGVGFKDGFVFTAPRLTGPSSVVLSAKDICGFTGKKLEICPPKDGAYVIVEAHNNDDENKFEKALNKEARKQFEDFGLNIPLQFGDSKVEVINDVVKSSNVPEQKAFFRDNPDGRILRTQFSVEPAIKSGALNVRLSRQFSTELPIQNFATGTIKDLGGRIRERLKLAKRLGKLSRRSGAEFVADLQASQYPVGTRFVRRGQYDLKVGSGISVARKVMESFEARAVGDNTWVITIDRFIDSDKGLSGSLGDLGLDFNKGESNSTSETYTLDLKDAAHLKALASVSGWRNGLNPKPLDTKTLDALGVGVHTSEYIFEKGGKAGVPLGAGRISADASKYTRYSVSYPDAIREGPTDNPGQPYVDALRTLENLDPDDTDAVALERAKLYVGRPGVEVQTTRTGTRGVGFGLSVTDKYGFGKYLGANLLQGLSFDRNTSTITGLNIGYAKENPSNVRVRASTIDIATAVSEANIRFSGTTEEKQIRDALSKYLFSGVGWDRLQKELSKASFKKLKGIVDQLSFGAGMRGSSESLAFKEVNFKPFDLNSENDRIAFDALVHENDAAPALALGKFKASSERIRNTKNKRFDANIKLIGLTLLLDQTDETTLDLKTAIGVDGELVTRSLETQSTRQKSKGITEEKLFTAKTATRSRNGKVQSSFTTVNLNITDAWSRRDERKTVSNLIRVGGLQVLERPAGPGNRKQKTKGHVKAVFMPQAAVQLAATNSTAAHFSAVLTASSWYKVEPPPYAVAELRYQPVLPLSPEAFAAAWTESVASKKLRSDVEYESDEDFPDLPPRTFDDVSFTDRFGVDAELLRALSRSEVMTAVQDGNLEKAKKILRRGDLDEKGRIPAENNPFTTMDAKVLESLLVRATMANMVTERRGVFPGEEERAERDTDDDAYTQMAQDYFHQVRRLDDDVLIEEHASTFSTLFDTEAFVAIREQMSAGAVDAASAAEASDKLYTAILSHGTPSRFGFRDNVNEAAAIFWLSLRNTAGPENVHLLVEGSTDQGSGNNANLLAIPPGATAQMIRGIRHNLSLD